MRLGMLSVTVLGAVLGVASGACTSTDDAPLYIEADYQLRCIDQCGARGGLDNRPREVVALEHEGDFGVRCDIDGDQGERELTFQASSADPTDDFAFVVRRLSIDDDSDAGRFCQVRVRDDNVNYEGGCTFDSPTRSNPCTFTLEIDGSDITGTVLCRNIRSRNNEDIVRSLVAPLTQNDEASFQVLNCPGL